jgi:outer membrane protein assembly factor BamB
MHTRTQSLVSIVFVVSLAVSVTQAENWPSWRGPRHDGTSTATGLPTTWDGTKNVKWRLDLPGPGPSTPAVWNDRIFLTAADGDDLVLLAVSTSGKELWRKKLDSGNRVYLSGESNMAAPSPTTDGKHVWVLLGTGLLACFDVDGKEIWKLDIQERYESFKINFGISSSPLLDGGRLYLQLLHGNQQLVVAFDKNTGKEIWKYDRATDAKAECLHSYASPSIYRSGEVELLLTHGADYLVAHRLSDGAEVWRLGGLQSPEDYNPSLRFVATPTIHEDLIVVPSAKNGPVIGIVPGEATGEITGSDKYIVWKLDNGTPDVPSPVIHEGLLYLGRENGILTCVDIASGEVVYSERPHRARHRGSPLVADGKIYLIGMDGTVTVLKTGREYQVLAQNKIDERLAASLAVAGNTIYLRSYDALYAIAGD